MHISEQGSGNWWISVWAGLLLGSLAIAGEPAAQTGPRIACEGASVDFGPIIDKEQVDHTFCAQECRRLGSGDQQRFKLRFSGDIHRSIEVIPPSVSFGRIEVNTDHALYPKIDIRVSGFMSFELMAIPSQLLLPGQLIRKWNSQEQILKVPVRLVAVSACRRRADETLSGRETCLTGPVQS